MVIWAAGVAVALHRGTQVQGMSCSNYMPANSKQSGLPWAPRGWGQGRCEMRGKAGRWLSKQGNAAMARLGAKGSRRQRQGAVTSQAGTAQPTHAQLARQPQEQKG